MPLPRINADAQASSCSCPGIGTLESTLFPVYLQRRAHSSASRPPRDASAASCARPHDQHQPDGAGSLSGVLGRCSPLVALNLTDSGIGDEGTGRLAGVL